MAPVTMNLMNFLLCLLASFLSSGSAWSVGGAVVRRPFAPTTTSLRMSDAQEDDSKIHTGTVKWFNTLKGFGFILPDQEGMPDVFVHQTEIRAQGFRSLMDGEPVEYQLTTDDRNRHKALSVTGPNGAQVQGAPFRPSSDYESY